MAGKGKKKGKAREDYCVEPIDGPKKMAAQAEKLVRLLLTIVKQGSVVTEDQAGFLDEIFLNMESESSRGAAFGRAVQRAMESIKTNRPASQARKRPSGTYSILKQNESGVFMPKDGTTTRGAEARVPIGHYVDDECEYTVENFEKYVDDNFNPLLDAEGRLLYEVEVLSTVSPNAQKIGRILFDGAVRAAKASR